DCENDAVYVPTDEANSSGPMCANAAFLYAPAAIICGHGVQEASKNVREASKNVGGHGGRAGGSSSLPFSGRARSWRVSDQAAPLVGSDRLYRRLRHRRHRLRRAAPYPRMAHRAEVARLGADGKQFWRVVRLADLRLGRRSLWPQDVADHLQSFVRRVHLLGGLFD